MRKYIVTHGIRIAQDFVPETFGRLTTLGPRFMIADRTFFVCQCSCDSIIVARTDSLKSGHAQSCGCLHKDRVRVVVAAKNKKHGKTRSQEHKTWSTLIQRCTNPNNHKYKDYGGRGIYVEDAWHPDRHPKGQAFLNFLADMGERPSKDHSIDRIDNDGPYSKENCRWATREEQQNNKRNNRFLEFRGKSQTVAQWARELGIKRTTIKDRLASGWTVECALTSSLINQLHS